MKHSIRIKTISLILLLLSGCNNFMEFPPAAELTIDKISEQYSEIEKLVHSMYTYCVPLYRDGRGGTSQARFGVGTIYAGGITDEGQVSQLSTGSAIHRFYNGNINSGNYSEDVYASYWLTIRKAYVLLNNISRTPDATNDQIKRIEAEAKIMIALVYFEMFKRYGGVPLVKDAYTGSESLEEINKPRATLEEVYDYMIELLDDVTKNYGNYLPGNVSDLEFGRFPMAFAYALKARIKLYAASPLYNTNQPYSMELGDNSNLICFMKPYDRNRWKEVADAATEAINFCVKSGFLIVDDYSKREDGWNYSTATQEFPAIGNTEVIWGLTASGAVDGYWKLNAAVRGLRGDFTTSSTSLGSGANQVPINQLIRYEIDDDKTPGQFIDWNERREYPLENIEHLLDKESLTATEASLVKKELANAARRHYEGIKIDSRFYASIIYNGDPNYGNFGPTGDVDMADAYVIGSDQPIVSTSALHGTCSEIKRNVTSLMYLRKYQRGYETRVNSTLPFNIYMRLAELYMIRAEANNEYYDSPQLVPGNQIYTDLEIIRSRSGMVNVPQGLSKESMREIIAHERCIEFFHEDHRWFDLRRTLKSSSEIPVVIYKPVIKKWYNSETSKVPVKISYEVGTVKIGNQTKRYWSDKMYMNPFPQTEMNKFYGLIQNPGW